MKSWSSANSTRLGCVVVARRLQHDEEVAVVQLELGPLVGADGVLDGQLVQAELLAHGLELLVGRLVEPDPHEAVRLAGRLEGQLERQLAVAPLAVRVHGAVHDHAAIFPHAWQARRAWIPPPTSPTCEADAARLLDAYREDPHAAGRHLPAVGPRRAPRTTWPAPTRGTAPRCEHGPSDRVRFKQSPQAPEGDELPDWYEDNVRGLVEALSTMDTAGTVAHLGRRAAGVVLPAPHGPRDGGAPLGRCRRSHRSRRSRSTASTSTSGCSLPWRRATHSPPHGTIHLHATDIDGEWLVPSGRTGSPSSTATPRATSRSAAAPRDLLLWAWNRVPVDDRFEVFGDPSLLDAWRTGVAI